MYSYSDTLALIAEAEGLDEDVDEYSIEDTKIADEELKSRLIVSSGATLAVLSFAILSLVSSSKNLVLTFSILILIVAVGGLSKLPTYSSGWPETIVSLSSSMSGFYYRHKLSQESKLKIGVI